MTQKKTALSGVLSLVGNTPLIPLGQFFEGTSFETFGKLEFYNPSGSIKDRAALNMILDAWNKGFINQNTTIIESSSGNTGVALGQVCSCLGLKFICVVDIHALSSNKNIIRAYGGQIDLVQKAHPQKGFLGARLERIQYLLKTIPNSFNCDQYRNDCHPKSHQKTVQEILAQLGKTPDYIFCALSTCGTIKGIAETVRERGMPTKIIAVDAVGSVIFGGKLKRRLIPGHGASVVPPFFYKEVCDDYIHVSDIDCIEGCRHLIREEGLFVGGSAGGVATAIKKYAHKIPFGSTCVAILADKGERYINTIYSDDWVLENYGCSPIQLRNKINN